MLEFDVVSGIVLAIAILVVVRVALPYLKKNGISDDIYSDIKMGLLLFGYAFREDKVKGIINVLISVVVGIEKLDMAPHEKQNEAVGEVFLQLLEEFDIALDPEAIKLMVGITVAYLPPTNPEVK